MVLLTCTIIILPHSQPQKYVNAELREAND